jgi:hypothetical protein
MGANPDDRMRRDDVNSQMGFNSASQHWRRMIEALMMPHLILLGCVDREDLPDEVERAPLLKDPGLMGPMVGHGRGASTWHGASDLEAGSEL